MGGGPDREHMLIVLRSPDPKDQIAKIKERFPYIDVTYFQIKSTRANNVPAGEMDVPKGHTLNLTDCLAHFLQQASFPNTAFFRNPDHYISQVLLIWRSGYSDGLSLQSFGNRPR